MSRALNRFELFIKARLGLVGLGLGVATTSTTTTTTSTTYYLLVVLILVE